MSICPLCAKSGVMQCSTKPPTEAAYLLSQWGHDAVNFGSRTSFILAPQDGQRKTGDVPARRFTLSTTSGFVRAWLKL